MDFLVKTPWNDVLYMILALFGKTLIFDYLPLQLTFCHWIIKNIRNGYFSQNYTKKRYYTCSCLNDFANWHLTTFFIYKTHHFVVHIQYTYIHKYITMTSKFVMTCIYVNKISVCLYSTFLLSVPYYYDGAWFKFCYRIKKNRKGK